MAEDRYSCSTHGDCEPDQYGRLSASQCRLSCQRNTPPAEMQRFFIQNPHITLGYAPSDRVQLLSEKYGLNVSPAESYEILTLLARDDLFAMAYYPELYEYLQAHYTAEDLAAPLLEANTEESIELYLQLQGDFISDQELVGSLMAALRNWDSGSADPRIDELLVAAGPAWQQLVRDTWSTWIVSYLQSQNNELDLDTPSSPLLIYTLQMGNVLLLDQLDTRMVREEDVQSVIRRRPRSNVAERLQTWWEERA